MFSKETCEMTIKILSTCYPLQFWEYSPAMELLRIMMDRQSLWTGSFL